MKAGGNRLLERRLLVNRESSIVKGGTRFSIIKSNAGKEAGSVGGLDFESTS